VQKRKQFEDTKGVIRSRKSYNDQKKRPEKKRTNSVTKHYTEI